MYGILAGESTAAFVIIGGTDKSVPYRAPETSRTYEHFRYANVLGNQPGVMQIATGDRKGSPLPFRERFVSPTKRDALRNHPHFAFCPARSPSV